MKKSSRKEPKVPTMVPVKTKVRNRLVIILLILIFTISLLMVGCKQKTEVNDKDSKPNDLKTSNSKTNNSKTIESKTNESKTTDTELEKGRNLKPDADDEYLKKVSESMESVTAKPNVIIVLTDDLGYSDLSCYGSSLIKTPNIDKLAKEGVALTNYYAANAVCSPSRAGLLTGRYPLRAHVPTVLFPSDSSMAESVMGTYSYNMEGISPDEILLSDVLQAVDYNTACLGKWHLGDQEGFLPNDNGFDYFYGSYYSNDMTPYAYYKNSEIDMAAPVDQTILTKKLTSEAVTFIKESGEQPFFLYYAVPFPHYPENASDDFTNTSEAGLYGDCVQEIDWSVGEIMNTLKEEGLDKNTLVIFTSDNGPWFEGGTERVEAEKVLILMVV